jgi:hypothetical protein
VTDSTWSWRRRLFLANSVFLVTVAARDGRRFWHVFAAVVHAFLGTANLVIFQGFVAWGLVPAGVLATVAHFALVTAHTAGFMVSRAPVRQR